MTLLHRRDGESSSYLELAEFLRMRGSPADQQSDLHELWTRVVFNILVSNRDDHLRNHGFILGTKGWRLAPAYDLNPNIERLHHQLAIDTADPTPDVELALSSASFYGIRTQDAKEIVQRVRGAVSRWQIIASTYQIPRAEIELLAQAFPSETGGS
jgi:serine/threonine-protein kinase HipA